MSFSSDSGIIQPAEQFNTTHWSVVLEAGKPGSKNALAKLCQSYWYPLYSYVRRQGRSAEDAQDLTQAFFMRLLDGNLLRAATPLKGRFRSFLLACLKNFMADEWDRSRAQKRGGGQECLSLDEHDAEGRYLREAVHEMDADRIFERRWALTVLEQALGRLEAEYVALGKRALFDQLHPSLTGEKHSRSYAQIGAELKMTEGAVKVAAHRMHRRHGQLIRGLIAQTISDPAEIDDEIRHLLAVLSR